MLRRRGQVPPVTEVQSRRRRQHHQRERSPRVGLSMAHHADGPIHRTRHLSTCFRCSHPNSSETPWKSTESGTRVRLRRAARAPQLRAPGVARRHVRGGRPLRRRQRARAARRHAAGGPWRARGQAQHVAEAGEGCGGWRLRPSRSTRQFPGAPSWPAAPRASTARTGAVPRPAGSRYRPSARLRSAAGRIALHRHAVLLLEG